MVTKCIKNKDKSFTWNKTLGSCGAVDQDDENQPDEAEPVDDETDSENPGCKDVNEMITDDNLTAVCKTYSGKIFEYLILLQTPKSTVNVKMVPANGKTTIRKS